jgi:hypothetical protein
MAGIMNRFEMGERLQSLATRFQVFSSGRAAFCEANRTEAWHEAAAGQGTHEGATS